MIYPNVRNERQMRATTGFTFDAFEKLLRLFIDTYEQRHELSLSNRLSYQTNQSKLNTYEERLFFILFQLKNGLTFDVLGCLYGMSTSNAKRNFEDGLTILRLALSQANVLPKREFQDVRELAEFLHNKRDLWIDATELPVQRPDNEQQQKERYSEKKRHSLKSMVISDAGKTIVYLSKVVNGSIHDFQLLKDNFQVHLPWFKEKNLYVDSGYQGIESSYEVNAVIIPFKRKKTDAINASLQEIKRAFNKRVSRGRPVN